MNFEFFCPLHSASRAAALGALAALASLLVACGGNGDSLLPLTQAAAADSQPAPATLRLEGCVVDEFFIPCGGSKVRVLGADGRLLGHSISNKEGVFTLQVPARQVISITVNEDGGDALVIATGHGSLSRSARACTTRKPEAGAAMRGNA